MRITLTAAFPFTLTLTLTLALTSLSACDLAPEPDDADRTYDALEAPEPFIAALNGECDDSDPDCAQALDHADDLTLEGDDDDPQALLTGSCPVGASCSALSLFENSTSATSHLLSLDDHPATIDYINTPPGSADKEVWLMGDWNGDGIESPGYYDQGQFRYTDVSSAPTNSWSQQLSMVQQGDRPRVVGLVAGRFLPGYINDCVGIIYKADEPKLNGDEMFSMEYWCDLAPNAIKSGTQWIGAVLPDSTFPAGEHEFVAGNWDEGAVGEINGIDEIAIRKDRYISYSLVDPSSGNAAFAQAQLWDVPPGELAETGVFVSGDWDGDGKDSWGVLYDDNHFYYRNVLTWNPGPTAYYLQHIDNLFTDRSVSSHQSL